MATTDSKTVKLTVTLSNEVVQALKDMASANGISVTEQLRRSISTQKWLHGVLERNERVVVENPATGKSREVEFAGGR
ncbi:hypothetical protein QLQ12_34645 [Actinoplanes sp. NEAU-A12]|uniref:Ribbon-helix-helix protein CopG domain-containing protein n=1 Tax=Actinoplanes sandaracinus TaxID=3045177 RepID=A0ABT6WVJ1_9ACTN|nr:hypothetical protein [Actinoplanes sandaracinus]MDI6103766.1 hypothetical protein [Actinoplanes sandaracinus]